MKHIDITYYHPLFKKMNRKEVIDRFVNWMDISDSQVKDIPVLLELLFISLAEELAFEEHNIEIITSSWNKSIAPLKHKFSDESIKQISYEDYKESLDQLIQHPIKNKILSYLSLEISLAEYRGIDYEEKKIQQPLNYIPTPERLSFFKSLVPLNTKWKI